MRAIGYHTPQDHYDAFQAIDEDEYVECDVCGNKVGYVWGFVAEGMPRLQLCGDCACQVDGRSRYVGGKPCEF